MRVFLRLIGFIRPHPLMLAAAVALGVGTVASNVGLLATAGFLISLSALQPILVAIILPAWLVRIFGIGRAFSRYFERLVSHNLTFRLLRDIRTWFYERLEPLAPARLGGYRSGDLLSRTTNDVEELENLYLRILSPIIVAVVISTGVAAILWVFFSPALGVSTFAFLAVTGVGVPLTVSRMARGLGERELALRGELNARMVEGVQGVGDILAFGRESEKEAEISELNHRLSGVQRRMAFINGLQETLTEAMTSLAVVSALVLAIPLVNADEIPGTYLAFVALMVLASFEAVQPLGPAFQFLGRSVAAGERLFEIIDAEPAVRDPKHPSPLPQDTTLELDGASLRYSEGEEFALRDASFTLSPGQRIAIVGPSGAGKSTIAALALRFWDATEGSVRLGGEDVRNLSQEQLRARISLVSQNEHIFNDTLRNNLLLARPQATDEELTAALIQGGLHDFTEMLDEPLGESGMRLSGGERQRVAIARALLKDAPLLILDEPTANLDPATELRLLDELAELSRESSTLLITHRLVNLHEMDEILVLNEGHITERGTHDQLLHKGGLYASMYETQRQILQIA